jgi:hypothetical protein
MRTDTRTDRYDEANAITFISAKFSCECPKNDVISTHVNFNEVLSLVYSIHIQKYKLGITTTTSGGPHPPRGPSLGYIDIIKFFSYYHVYNEYISVDRCLLFIVME